jgi:[ribosomal protein S18]-alanine N-acetyltransferase
VDFTLRDFRPSDLETLWKIDQQCFVPDISYSRAELKTYIERRDSFTIVAASGASLVGFIVFESSKRGAGHIITIDVIADARRAGVGSKLLDRAEARLRAAHCHSVLLETAVDNKPALAFYKRHNYFLVGTHPRYYGNGLDAFVLRKDLPLAAPIPFAKREKHA